jgi:hypothetical protein
MTTTDTTAIRLSAIIFLLAIITSVATALVTGAINYAQAQLTVEVRNSTGQTLSREITSDKPLYKLSFAPSLHPSYGIWTYPILLFGAALGTMGMLYRKRTAVVRIIVARLFSFEVSKRIALFVLAGLLLAFIAMNYGKLFQEETFLDYTGNVKPEAENYNITTSPFGGDAYEGNRILFQVRGFLNHASLQLFGIITMIPFLASLAVLVLTYLTTLEITGKRFAGILAFAFLVQSPIFSYYSASPTYNNYWVLFFLLSLYLVVKRSVVSPVMFYLSISSKSLAALFAPFSAFFLARSDSSRRKKIALILPYAVFVVIMAAVIARGGFEGVRLAVDEGEFWDGLNSVPILLQKEGLLLVLLLPIAIGLFMAMRRGVIYADAVCLLIGGAFFIYALLEGLTNIENLDYRMIPLLAFTGMGLGTVFSNNNSKNEHSPKTWERGMFTGIFLFTSIFAFITVTTFIFPVLYSDQNFR